jgi:DNA-binding PadR family transcriptional regulator
MSQPHSKISLAVLNYIHKQGNANYLEIERALSIANGVDRIRNLRVHGYIEAIPKERKELKRYKLTTVGQRLLGLHLKQQTESTRNVMSLPKYAPQILAPSRAGSMNAFAIPSRGNV